MAKTKHGLQETQGMFQIRGTVTGTEKGNFYDEKKTKTGKDMRLLNFGVNVEKNKAVYLSLNGMAKDEVYFSKKMDDGKVDVKKVQWANRMTFKEEGYGLIGLNVGLEKDDKGKNIKHTYVEFDACKKISELLKDDMSIFTKGKIEFSSFDSNDGKKRAVKFIPQQLSLTSKEIDFESEDFELKSDFKQQIIFMGIDKEKEDRFVLSAKIVTYSSIEDAEFIIKDSKLAQMFKKNLKPYNAITVHGNIVVEESVEDVQDDDCWGEEDPTKKILNPTKRELVITGATPSTIDRDTYSESNIEEAIAKLTQSENAKDDWGTSSSNDEDDEW